MAVTYDMRSNSFTYGNHKYKPDPTPMIPATITSRMKEERVMEKE
jgi:hypothetical protein